LPNSKPTRLKWLVCSSKSTRGMCESLWEISRM
jgi:hypothetical protein